MSGSYDLTGALEHLDASAYYVFSVSLSIRFDVLEAAASV